MSHANVLLIAGLVGIIFYVTGPIFFPHVPNIRQPELLPVYSLMMGLGGLLRKQPTGPKPPGAPVPDIPPDMTPKESKDDVQKVD